MRIVAHLSHLGALRHLGGPLALLAEQGHSVVVLTHKFDEPTDNFFTKRAIAAGVEIRLAAGQGKRGGGPGGRLHRDLLDDLRAFRESLLYAHPTFNDAAWLRARIVPTIPRGVVGWASRFDQLGAHAQASALRSTRWLDRTLPPLARRYERLLADLLPDVVIGTAPPNSASRHEIDLLKIASRQGIATVLMIMSWDNLTTNQSLGFVPDRVFVWNDEQVRELETLHAIRSDRAVVTGAAAFDHWFGQQPGSREAFCKHVGLEPGRLFAVYLGSSAQMAPMEPRYFRAWLALLRGSGRPALRDLQVLVRPHPTVASLAGWVEASALFPRDLAVRMWPRLHEFQGEEDAFFRDALAHSVVAVGLNTSAMIDAAIHGTPVCTWENAELQPRLQHTPHYRYLSDPDRGVTLATSDPAQHLTTLTALIEQRNQGVPDERSRAFVARFIRPRGIDRPVAAVVADELLVLAARPTDAPVPGWAARRFGDGLAMFAFALGLPLKEHRARLCVVRLGATVVTGSIQAAECANWLKRKAGKTRHRAQHRVAAALPRRLWIALRRQTKKTQQ